LNVFLQPLSKEEEEKYLTLLSKGKSDEAREARNLLIEHNLRLVAHIVKKYQNTDIDQQDLISTGTIGLIKGITSYNPDKNSKLATYAARCIENELLMLLRSKKKSNREISLYEPIGTDHDGNEIQIVDIIHEEEHDFIEVMNTSQKEKLLYPFIQSVLSQREREILCMRYGLHQKKPLTQREIGDLLGISRSYISRIEKKALEKLKEAYKKASFDS